MAILVIGFCLQDLSTGCVDKTQQCVLDCNPDKSVLYEAEGVVKHFRLG